MNNLIATVSLALYKKSTFSCQRFICDRGLSRYFSSSVNCKMPIKVGDNIPNVKLYENNPINEVDIGKLCAENHKVIIFAVPGAFTPGCSKTHLPSYLEHYDELKKCGVSEIICISVNDPFVMAAWSEFNKCAGKIRMLADTNATFTKKVDLAMDMPMLGGTRSKRYSMVVQDGVVKSIQVEPDGTGLTCSLAHKLKL